jgi:hypothetical protein
MFRRHYNYCELSGSKISHLFPCSAILKPQNNWFEGHKIFLTALMKLVTRNHYSEDYDLWTHNALVHLIPC